MNNIWLTLFFGAILLNGCSTAYYKTQQDKNYLIDKKEAVFVLQPTESTVEDKQFARLLAHTLQSNGFKISEGGGQMRICFQP